MIFAYFWPVLISKNSDWCSKIGCFLGPKNGSKKAKKGSKKRDFAKNGLFLAYFWSKSSNLAKMA